MKVCVAAIVAGFVMLGLSSIWGNLFPGTSSWTQEKALRWSAVQDRLHNLGFIVNNPNAQVKMHGGPDPAEIKQEYDRLTIEHEQLSAEFNGAAARPRIIATVLKWSGISIAVIGLIGWYAVNQAR